MLELKKRLGPSNDSLFVIPLGTNGGNDKDKGAVQQRTGKLRPEVISRAYRIINRVWEYINTQTLFSLSPQPTARTPFRSFRHSPERIVHGYSSTYMYLLVICYLLTLSANNSAMCPLYYSLTRKPIAGYCKLYAAQGETLYHNSATTYRADLVCVTDPTIPVRTLPPTFLRLSTTT